MAYLTPFHLAIQLRDKLPYRALILTDEPSIPDDAYLLQEWYCPNPLCPCNEVHLKAYARDQKMLVVDILFSLDPQQPVSPALENEEDIFPVYSKKLFRLIAEYVKSNPDYGQALRQHYLELRAVAVDPSHPNHKAVDYWGKTGRKLPTSSQKRKRHKH